MLQDSILNSLKTAQTLINSLVNSAESLQTISDISDRIVIAFKNKQKILICGNGGSACDSMHFAEEFTGKFRKDRIALPAISLTDIAHVTCVANDYGYENIFSRGLEAFGTEGDVFIGLSTSGNSANVVQALQKARNIGCYTVALLGGTGGQLKDQAHSQLIIEGKTSDRVQEIHMLILHLIIEGVERMLFPQNYNTSS